nr:uncharacterized protein LOC127333069 isoform X1 [Lolium perenne]
MMHFFIYQDHTLVQSYVNHLWVQIGVYKAPQCEVIDWRLNMACNDGSGLGRSMYMQEVEALLVIKHQKGQTQELDGVKSMCLQIIKKMVFNIRMGIHLDVRAGGSVSRLVAKHEVKATHAANGDLQLSYIFHFTLFSSTINRCQFISLSI